MEKYTFYWICFLCKKKAKKPHVLECEAFDNLGVVRDSDGRKWVKCQTCYKPFHVKCARDVLNPCVEYHCWVCEPLYWSDFNVWKYPLVRDY